MDKRINYNEISHSTDLLISLTNKGVLYSAMKKMHFGCYEKVNNVSIGSLPKNIHFMTKIECGHIYCTSSSDTLVLMLLNKECVPSGSLILKQFA